jgi:hypothetical protein
VSTEVRQQVLILIDLPNGTAATADVLGTRWSVERTPAPCTLVMPRPPSDFDGPWDLLPPAIPDADSPLEWFVSEGHWEAFWGSALAGQNVEREFTEARVRRAVAVTTVEAGTYDERGSLAETTARAIGAWLADVIDWLDVLAGLDHPDEVGWFTTPGRWTYVHEWPLPEDADVASHQHRRTVHRDVRHLRVMLAGVDDWTFAVERANASDAPPVEHVLLRDAHAAWRRGDGRRAVIDAASAAEIALADSIRNHLTQASRDDDIKQALKNCSGVVGLFDLAAALGLALPLGRGAVVGNLAGARNRAVHAGTTPSEDEIGKALRLVGELVRTLKPAR